jgi:hypothetical protein
MMSESSPHVQKEVDSHCFDVLVAAAVVCTALLCICCAGFIIAWIPRRGLIFSSIGLVAQIISLAQGKQYHKILSHKKTHSKHGNLQAMTAMRIHTTSLLHSELMTEGLGLRVSTAASGRRVEAIQKDVEIISSGAVSGSADKHLPGLVQKSTSLAQLRADSASRDNRSMTARYLQSQATRLSSRALATRVADDPFWRVKKMIKDLIVRRMESANEGSEHKRWWDAELSTNEQTRKDKTDGVETLPAEFDQLQAPIAKHTEDIAELTKAVAEIDVAMATATSLR